MIATANEESLKEANELADKLKKAIEDKTIEAQQKISQVFN
jgi:hypothetical protein